MKKSTHRQFVKLMQAHGLTVDTYKGGHFMIRKNGALVGTLAHTGEMNATRQCVRDLVRDGHLPEETKRVKFS